MHSPSDEPSELHPADNKNTFPPIEDLPRHVTALTFALCTPSLSCRGWPVFGRLMTVCSSQPSRLITAAKWYLQVTPGQSDPSSYKS